jgi:ArsR family transcriptional regulator, arsenate/arsenite/antimonite-responsive transcriptional repressor
MPDRLRVMTLDGPTTAVRPALDHTGALPALRALADPTRLGIFALIAAQAEPICACEIVDRFTVSQPTIAHHLRTLREAGLITSERDGVWAYYAVDRDGFARVQATLAALTPATPRADRA